MPLEATLNTAARIAHYRTKDDRLRQKVVKSSLTLKGEDMAWFVLNVFGYRGSLEEPGDECWEWHGMVSGSGKPIMRMNGEQVGVLRAVYATWIRPVKELDVIRQACGNTRCVNPTHLASRKYGWPGELTDYARAGTMKRKCDAKV